LTGTKTGVLDGSVADAFVVNATANGKKVLVLVEATAAQVAAQETMDHRETATVTFSDAPCERLDGGPELLERVLDDARIALAAEMLGGMQAAFERTLAWLNERHQFGVPIGSFQALQHRAADCFIEIELARSAVLAAAQSSPADRAQLASLAQARCCEAFDLVATEAIQMHGGIGMTEEHDIGYFLKRAKVCQVLLGDAAWHRRRWASLRGY
jgi:alkylation response protein AidB-like acyl-CoA dehydrogenase